jgi:hypothetical protein
LRNLAAVELDELVPRSAHPSMQLDERLLVEGAKTFGRRLGE